MSTSVSIEHMLEETGAYVGTIVGASMEPLLRTGRDVVIIEKPGGRLRVNDVALYRRGEKYVLHRVIKVLPDSYVIIGDNCAGKEYGVTDGDVLGVMTGFHRKGKKYSVTDPGYRLYVLLTRIFQPARIAYLTLRGFAAKIYRRISR